MTFSMDSNLKLLMVANVQLNSLHHLLLAKNFSIAFQGHFNVGFVQTASSLSPRSPRICQLCFCGSEHKMGQESLTVGVNLF